jgi:hypothetical protein
MIGSLMTVKQLVESEMPRETEVLEENLPQATVIGGWQLIS